MTRTGLLMKVGIFVAFFSVVFSFVGLTPTFRSDPVDESTATGTQVEATNSTVEDESFLVSGAKCSIGGLLFSAESCGEAVSDVLGLFGLEGISETVVTITNGIQQFTDGVKSLLTFNIPGAPTWVRAIIAIPLNLGLVYIVIAVGRGI